MVRGEGGEFGLVTWSPQRVAVSVRLSTGVTASGLLGNNNGDPRDDLTRSSGAAAPDHPNLEGYIHTLFAESWRITDNTSLFTYADGESNDTYTDRSYPDTITRLGDFGAVPVADARAACTGAAEGSVMDGCILDFLTSGRTFLDSALEAKSATAGTTPIDFDTEGRLAVNFDATIPHGFMPDHLSYEADLSEFAGSYRSNDTYTFEVPAIRNSHTGLNIGVDLLVLGALDQPGDRSVYIDIDGSRVANVYLSADGAEAYSGQIDELERGTLADGRPYVRYRYTREGWEPGGTGLQGSIKVNGFPTGQPDAIGIDNLTLTQVNPSVEEPVHLAYGDVVLPDESGSVGVLTSKGQRDLFRFTVPEDNYDTTIQPLHGDELRSLRTCVTASSCAALTPA